MKFNAIAALVDALKTWPEPVELPNALIDADHVQLADARSRLQQISQCANELRKVIEGELVERLDGAPMRYGDTIIEANRRGTHKVSDIDMWWDAVAKATETSEDPAGLLASLYRADGLRLGGLKQLAEELHTDVKTVRNTFIAWEPPTAGVSVRPISQVSQELQKLEDGEVYRRESNDA